MGGGFGGSSRLSDSLRSRFAGLPAVAVPSVSPSPGNYVMARIRELAHRAAWVTVWRPTFQREDSEQERETSEAIVRLMLVPTRPTSSDL